MSAYYLEYVSHGLKVADKRHLHHHCHGKIAILESKRLIQDHKEDSALTTRYSIREIDHGPDQKYRICGMDFSIMMGAGG